MTRIREEEEVFVAAIFVYNISANAFCYVDNQCWYWIYSCAWSAVFL